MVKVITAGIPSLMASLVSLQRVAKQMAAFRVFSYYSARCVP